MDARQQDPRAGFTNGAAQTSSSAGTAGPGPSATSSKGIGWAELISIALGLGGLYLLIKVRSEAIPLDDSDASDEPAPPPVQENEQKLAGWGHTYPHPDNPPAWVVDEQVWERAKE